MSNPLRTYLVSSGLVSESDCAKAEHKADKEKITLQHALEALQLAPEEQLLDTIAKYYRVPKTNLGEMDVPRSIIDLIPKDLAQKHRVIPIDRAGNNIIVAMGDPRNLDAINAIRFSAGFFPKPVLSSELRLTEAIEKYYGKILDIDPVDQADPSQPRKQVKQERHDIAASARMTARSSSS